MSNRLKIYPVPGADIPGDQAVERTRVARRHFQAFITQLRGRRYVFLGTIAGIWLVAAAVTLALPERFTGTAKILVETAAANKSDGAAATLGKAAPVESEVEILRSRGLAERVVARLALHNDPEFASGVASPTVSSGTAAQAKGADPRIVDRFLDRLEVTRTGQANTIDIGFSSASPRRAAEIANAVAELYVVERFEAGLDTSKRATEWMSQRLSELRDKAEASEQAVQKQRKRAELILAKETGERTRRIEALKKEVADHQARRARIDARLKKAEAMLRTGGPVRAAAVLSSQTLNALREREARQRRRVLDLTAEADDQDPRLFDARAEWRRLKSKIEGEVGRILQSLRNEINVTLARENTVRFTLNKIEAEEPAPALSGAQLVSLQHQATANRAQYEAFLTRFKETTARKEIQPAAARIISRAAVPLAPSFPRVPDYLAIAAALAALAGLAVIAVMTLLDRGFRSLQQIEQETGLPTLGLVPKIPGRGDRRTEPPDYILERPVSAYSESVRALYTDILLSNADRPPKLLMVASAAPNEGKTSLALSFARMVGRIGQKKVVLVDCDTRHPQVHRTLGLSETPGLVEYLAGEASLEEVLQVDEQTNALVIAAGRKPSNSVELLTSERFSDLLKKLSEACDLVVLDSPPVLAISDAKILARLVDKTIFVARWAKTRRELVLRGVKELLQSGADLAGVALTQVDVRQHARFGFGDSGIYHGSYQKYYSG